jgi:hypothetical protein
VSREDAILSAFGVQLAYEASSESRLPWPFAPLPGRLSSAYKSRDVATAYRGAVFGADLADGIVGGLGEEALAPRFESAFRSTVRALLAVPSSDDARR